MQAEINITPQVDVVLVLQVAFMATASAKARRGDVGLHQARLH